MSVTQPMGFTAAGVSAGIKASGARDLAIIATSCPDSIASGVFTVNRAAAAPVRLSREHLRAGPATRAFVINSGCANAATGRRGDAAASRMAEAAAVEIGCDVGSVLVASTGTIGSPMPVDAVVAGIGSAVAVLGRGCDADERAALAIMTTDKVPKQALVSDGEVTVGAIAKGAGMVRPDMATMIVAITTDAVVPPNDLDAALRSAVDDSFHALNIDGCSSTNDTVVVMASGAAGATRGAAEMGEMLGTVCRDLSSQLAADAEGATRVVTIDVSGVTDDREARLLGRAVADSALVRSAFFGGDPNWGRIIGALGAAPVPVNLDAVGVAFAGVTVAANGVAADFDEDALVASLARGDFVVTLDLGHGRGRASVLTTDLTPDYVRFNADRS